MQTFVLQPARTEQARAQVPQWRRMGAQAGLGLSSPRMHLHGNPPLELPASLCKLHRPASATAAWTGCLSAVASASPKHSHAWAS